MNTIEAVIFDWAGTTVDFGCMAPVQAFVDTFANYGMVVTLAETRKPMGTAKRDHIETMLAMPRIRELFKQHHGHDHTQADIDAMYKDFEDLLMASLSQYTEPKPFVLDTVNILREQGIKVGSTTGYNRAMMELVVPGAKAKGYEPDCWFCSNDVDNFGRPYPYMIFAAMQKLHITSVASVIKVGDTESDIAEGIAAGVWTVGVIEGSSEMGLSQAEFDVLNENEKEALRKKVSLAFQAYGADFVVDSMDQLPQVIAMINNGFEDDFEDDE